jgi:Domain of unknown function (DUF222)
VIAGRLHPANGVVFGRAAVLVGELEQLPADPGLAAGLVELRGLSLGPPDAVRATVLWDRLALWCAAQSMVTITEAVDGADMHLLASGVEAQRIIGEELAALTHVSSGAAMDRVTLVGQVGRTLPLAWEALDRGDLTLDHVKRLGWIPGRLGAQAAKAILELDPDGAADRAKAAKACADVRFHRGQYETALIEAEGDAVTLRQVMDRIETVAAALQRDSVEKLPIGVARVTALANLVLGKQAAARPVMDGLLVIDLHTWLGLTQHPGEIAGYGPISATTARQLAKDATFRLLLTDPTTGHVLHLGHTRYRPTAALTRYITARDRTCRHPGCQHPAIHCGLDHRSPWDHHGGRQGGMTDPDNLHSLCRRHHTLKTRKLWHVNIEPDGTETWTSALGFTHTTRPASYQLEPLEPPGEDEIPENIDDRLPEHCPDPPGIDDPLPEPSTITLEEYLEHTDDLERTCIYAANRHYHQHNLDLAS